MIAASLFSGIGAPEVAMPHWRWAWHAEIEKFPSAVMAARHPGSVNLGDVCAHDFTTRAAAIGRPDVLVFGSPCQSFSVAGKRLGLDDPRGNLALTALGIVDRLKPDWFVFENVPGLFSSFSGAEQEEGAVREGDVGGQADGEEDRDLAAFLSRVCDVGYSLAWGVLDAQWAGVAQRRQRLFAVGHSGDWRYPAAVLLEPESLCGNSPPRREAGKGIAPTIASRPTGGVGLGTDFDCDGGLISRPLLAKGNDSFDDTLQTYVTEVSHCLNAGGMGRQDYETETVIAHALRAEGDDASEDGTGRGTPLVSVEAAPTMRAGGNSTGGDRPYGTDVDTCDSLIAMRSMSSVRRLTAFSSKDYGADAGSIAPTLRAGGHTSSHPNAGIPPAITLISAVRRLTPRECERLQGFPDDYTLIEYRGKPAADGPRYKALGNSMAVPVIRWILERIELFETHVMPAIRKGKAA